MAGMLNSNMWALVGPQSANLDIQELRKYNLDPLKLLTQLVQIYVNCAQANQAGQAFLKAVVEAPRYDDKLLSMAAATLQTLSMDADVVAAFDSVVARVAVR